MNLYRLFECENLYDVVFDNEDLNEIANYLARNFPEFDYATVVEYIDTFIRHHGLSMDYVAAGVAGPEFHMEWGATHHDRGDFLLERVLQIRDGLKVAVHKLFVLPKDLQGRGLAKDILRCFYRQYQLSEIDRIELVAGKFVGGYAWALYGFHAVDPQQVVDIIERGRARLSISFEESELHLKIFHDYYQVNPLTASFPMRNLATSPGSRVLLQHTCWDGILDLRNDLQRELFETYLDLIS